MTTRTRKATGNIAMLVGRIGATDVRLAESGDHWPGYADEMTLKAGYWIGSDQNHNWAGPTKRHVAMEAIDRGYIDPWSGEALVNWL